MYYCEGRNCSVKENCYHHKLPGIAPNELVEYIDQSRMGSGLADSSGVTIEWMCGDNSRNYPLYVHTGGEQPELYHTLLSIGVHLYKDSGERKTADELLCELATIMAQNNICKRGDTNA